MSEFVYIAADSHHSLCAPPYNNGDATASAWPVHLAESARVIRLDHRLTQLNRINTNITCSKYLLLLFSPSPHHPSPPTSLPIPPVLILLLLLLFLLLALPLLFFILPSSSSYSYSSLNELPEDVATAPSPPIFRRRLKRYLFQKSYPDIHISDLTSLMTPVVHVHVHIRLLITLTNRN